MAPRTAGAPTGCRQDMTHMVIGDPKRVDAFGETITVRWWSRFYFYGILPPGVYENTWYKTSNHLKKNGMP